LRKQKICSIALLMKQNF